ncbi:PleD family two-component system response regulator [Riemerella anatipestifer]|uniref:Uncharacterized protein n=1 Tax=Riemerella anatipestifer TaxID=34085 RepID=A0A1S7DU40_RIEAN|nr:hypothetical protein [Riemerella anatipestifer]AQY22630.1 hypothetical protein AB406_1686 [Riemerella anatipestifer]MBO4232740.1 hypothetical protein [Riemerella anatipestifer]MCO4303649.1 hypothetical protein [Riemerella anatipestifer]MCO7352168.1 hypothetical protein [Riemerella anatipestifer]MCQ4040079.1 hypothetical protein [Riemerella anatipestifer]
MAYKLYYIEDSNSESRKSDLESLGFEVTQYDPEKDINKVISNIDKYKPDAIIMDYRFNEAKDNVCYDAPTIATTLRNKHRDSFKEIPIILISKEDKITDFYRDFLNQDLFDYSVSKEIFIKDKEKFRLKIESYINSYKKIKGDKFNILKILGLDNRDSTLVHSLISKKLDIKKGQIYEYSRFIDDNLIHAIGPLIGEDVLAARLGIDKEKSKDWANLLDMFQSFKYKGILSDVNKRWWAEKLEDWWSFNFEINNLRRLSAKERVKLLNDKFSFRLTTATKIDFSESDKFWAICKGFSTPLDPFDGIQIIKKDYKPWQEKEYYSPKYALENIDTINKFIDDLDIKYLRNLSKNS